MTNVPFADLEREIAKSRVALSLIAIVSVYLDPTSPQLGVMPLNGALGADIYAFGVLAAHLTYAVGILLCVRPGKIALRRIAWSSTVLDVAFGGAIALVTEGATSPARVFFAFAVLVVACRSGFRTALLVTIASAALYLALILVAPHRAQSVYAMRSFYLALTGYLIGYLAQQRLNVEARARDFETAAERHGIARSLHDGYVQALAGVSLRVEACRELLRRERPERALAELADLQQGLQREYEEVRAYVRSLVALDRRLDEVPMTEELAVSVEASFRCDDETAEHVLLIMLEGVRNARRHAGASTAAVAAHADPGRLQISIRDDGVGFPENRRAPWSIASRVAELGGDVQLDDERPGARLLIEYPDVMSAGCAPIRVVIADDHALFRAGLKSVLLLQEDVSVVGEIERASDLAGLALRTPCDVLLLDLQMERSSLLEIEKLKRRLRILVVTASEQVDDALLAMRLGARGVVLKHFEIETLMEGIRSVAAGRVWLPPVLRDELARREREPMHKGLTRREYEIVRHAALGMRNVEIAQRLLISEVTVKTHLTNVFQKLGLRDRVQLARYAIQAGIVRAHETSS